MKDTRYRDPKFNAVILESDVLNQDIRIEEAKSEVSRLRAVADALEKEVLDVVYAIEARPLTPEEEYTMAIRNKLDTWVAACGGSERAFKGRTGKEILYVYNPAQNLHAYFDVKNDMLLTREATEIELGLRGFLEE